MNSHPRPPSALSAVVSNDDEISLFAVATVLIRNRWRIARWTMLGGMVAFFAVFQKPRLYSASMAFAPQGADAGRSSLASLAGQFGLSAPAGGDYTQQPEFYVNLIPSREILLPIVRDTFVLAEKQNRHVSFMELFEIQGGGAAQEEAAIKKLRGFVKTGPVRGTGIVRVSVATEWPSVSQKISESLLDGLNEYNLRSRQRTASAERRFVETRLDEARDSLRAAEDRLQEFLDRNKSGINTSPSLSSTHQRLERQVSLRNAVVTTLNQQYEETRIREVRDTPTIAVVESPTTSTVPEPRRRAMSVVLGLVLGGVIGMVMVLIGAASRSGRSLNDPSAAEFFAELDRSKDTLKRLARPHRREV